MKRFYHERSASWIKHILAIGVFALVFGLFLAGISSASHKVSSEQTEALEKAVSRSIAHCYASEGRYPESLEYLEEHYGITYDEDKYFIDYQILGQNLFPDVTIIEK